MARTAEEAMRIESRRTKVARMYLTGITNQYEIAERLGLERISGQRTVSRDVEAIRNEWKASRVHDWSEVIGKELAKLEALEAEYWAAWERSKVECTRSRTRKREHIRGTDNEAEIRKEQRDGDPRFLDGVKDCIKQRRELLGLDAPKRQEVAGPGGGPIQMQTMELLSDEQLDAILSRHPVSQN